MTTADAEIREALLEGQALELIPEPDGTGWYCRIGLLPWTVEGRSSAEVMLRVAEILSTPIPEGKARQ